MDFSQPSSRVLSVLRYYVIMASILSISTGVIVLIGWFLDISAYKSILPNLPTMKFNTALNFLLAGVSLLFLREENSKHEKRIGQVFASLILVIALLTLSEYLFRRDLGIDQLLIKDLVTPSDAYPGRMAEATALGFIFIGLSEIFIDTKILQYLTLSVVFLSLTAVVGYLFDYSSLYQLTGYGSVALHTAINFLTLSLGLFAMRPLRGLMGSFTADMPGSRMMRRYLPQSVLLTIFLGWLVQTGEHLGIVNVTNDSVILVVLLIGLYSPLIYFYAKNINQTQQELHESEEHYRLLFDTMLDGFALHEIICDEDGKPVDYRFLEINPAFERFTGLRASDLTGKTALEALPGIESIWIERYGSVALTGEPDRFSSYSQELGHHYEVTAYRPKPGQFAVVFEDITERVQAEMRNKTQLRRLESLRAIDIAIASSHDIGQTLKVLIEETIARLEVDAVSVLLLNPASDTLEFAAGQGFRTELIQNGSMQLGKGIAGRVALERKRINVPNLAEVLDEFTRAPLFVEEGFIAYYGVPLVIKEKIIGVLEILNRASLNPDSDWLEYLEILAGQAAITVDNAQLFEKLQRSNIELEHRVEKRTAELNQTNAELERANRAKDEFLANMSHELRTPLNSILGLSETLLEQMRDPLSDKQQKSLQIIESSGRHLLELINDVLDLSKIEAGQFDVYPQVVDVNALCRSSLSFVKEQAMRKSITLNFKEDDHVANIYADSRRTKQILVNLLTNAVKFTPERGEVNLQVLADEEQDLIQFSVRDNGIGIAEDDLKRLFQPFVQVDSKLNRQFEGTGLGLSLVQKLTDLHGGSMSVESEVGKGSNFMVNLPWRKEIVTQQEIIGAGGEIKPPERSTQSSEEPSKRGIVLLAEDNMANILTIGEYVESRGYEVVVAHDGKEALEKAEEVSPGIILMDIQMPVIDGLEAIRRLRAMPRFKSTPIIALTALAMPGDRERCLEAGANEYMSKPVSLKSLVKTINDLLQLNNENKQYK
ncbi:MAG TPA: ATP-binding protein [Anaerolineales bacterium]|nr:ATP-binding protein [Anaerolineales bacterium]